MWLSMVYVKQDMTSTLLFALVAIVFTPNIVQTISTVIVKSNQVKIALFTRDQVTCEEIEIT